MSGYSSLFAPARSAVGLGVAVDYALGWGLDGIRARIVDLAGRLRTGLSAIPGVTVRDLGVEPESNEPEIHGRDLADTGHAAGVADAAGGAAEVDSVATGVDGLAPDRPAQAFAWRNRSLGRALGLAG